MTSPRRGLSATYRLQMHAGFTFSDAEDQVPYLADLGITHLYLSPVLQAVPGSAHGYDVLDHGRVSAELGGAEGLEALATAAHEHGLGILVDVVPNHMAFVAPESANAPLWQVLLEGRESPTASWFDIDWDAGGGRLAVPVLGDQVEALVQSGEIVLDRAGAEPVIRYHDHVFPVAPGTDDGDVGKVLGRQHYRLVYWRDSSTALNYRRFFDVTELIAVRVEDPEVFEATHRVLLDLHHRGVVDGFRIDHPDGLADPTGYLDQLAQACRPGAPVYVEKILEGEEELPSDWASAGTTGYDAMRALSLALADPSTVPTLDETWAATGGEPDLEAVVEEAKRLVVGRILTPEVNRLTEDVLRVAGEVNVARVREAVAELLVSGEVYRAYIRPGRPVTALARHRLDEAQARARASRPDLSRELDLLMVLATGERDEPWARDFAVRFQQTWGPVMAKGIEDTTFYRWHRQVGLNEVGGDPGAAAEAGPEVLHAWARRQQEHWPRGMTALSTHDTKRSEDVRARLLAVAADAESWRRCSAAFAAAADDSGVDRPTAHLVWQSVVGAGPITRERLAGYLTKALREAKQHSSWLDPDEDYEKRVLALADRALGPDPLRDVLDAAVAANRAGIRAMVLGQKLAQLCLPGVPDVYQGTELVDLSLVDPDNRRPVDYEARRARLAAPSPGGAADLDGEKLLVTRSALAVRATHADAFGEASSYEPLPVTGGDPAPVLGFVRGGTVACVVPTAARPAAWSDEQVSLPGGSWRDVLTGATHPGGALACAALFDTLPVSLLVDEG